MAKRITISKTSDCLYRAVIQEEYSTPWYYGENVAKALRGAPAEVQAHAARVEALFTHQVVEVVIKDRGGYVEVECVYGKHRRVLPMTSTDIGDALDKALRELRKLNE